MRTIKYRWLQDPLTLNRRKINVLVIENQKFFRDFIIGIYNQIENDDDFLFCADDLKEFKLSKYAILITDPFDLPIDEKKCITLLYKDMEKKVTEDYRIGLEKVNNTIYSFLTDLIKEYEIPLTFDSSLSITNLMKLADVHPDYEIDDYFQALIVRLKTLSNLFKKNLFFLVNIHDVLTSEELDMFYREASLLDIDLVLIEAREPKAKKENENIIVIDSDLCEILK